MDTAGRILDWLIVLVLALLAGVGIALWRHGKSATRRAAAPLTSSNGETVYSGLGDGGLDDNLDIDPLHEAEIYAAYGNREMALKVLTIAAAAAPDREDIRAKIAELQAD
jgi:Tfp pilus assembly protein FimV